MRLVPQIVAVEGDVEVTDGHSHAGELLDVGRQPGGENRTARRDAEDDDAGMRFITRGPGV